MLDGICPKCGSNDVYCDTNVPDKDNYRRWDTIMLQNRFLLPSTAILDNYVCARCGYLESYVPFQENLQEITENWTKVTPGPRRVDQPPADS